MSSDNTTDSKTGVCPVDHKKYSPDTRSPPNDPRSSSSCPIDEPPDTGTDTTIGHFHNMAKVIQNRESNDPHDIIPGMEIPATGRGNSESGQEWLNPSANQLYRSLARKNKPIEHEDSLSVAAIHAIVTQQTWDNIMKYEDLHSHQCKTPKLARFEGKDGYYSPKAKFFHYIMGLPWPYDRHDWTVDRCGKEVEYVIDYYAIPVSSERNQEIANRPESEQEKKEVEGTDRYAPFIQDEDIEFMYTIDARPKMNSFGNLVDRFKLAWRAWRNGEQWF